MQDTWFFARSDSFPAASAVPAQRRQHEIDKPNPWPTTCSSEHRPDGLRDSGTKPCCSLTLMSFADNEQPEPAGVSS
jgi:hypothetical protein